VLSERFEPPEFDPPQAVASRVSASTMNEERGRILAILGVRDTLRGMRDRTSPAASERPRTDPRPPPKVAWGSRRVTPER
jgi:hypothetical protein